ncbi:MAG TPA: polysaccharide biosynthesis/export family protein [Acidobacteriaceae bacterium]
MTCLAGGTSAILAQMGAQSGAPASSQSGVQSGVQTGVQGLPTSPAALPPAATTAPAISGADQAMLYPGDDFTLSPGDLIDVRVFMQVDYVATVRIGMDGTVQLPLIGSVPLQGLTVRAAQNLVADRLREGQFYRNPEVIIQVLNTVNGSVTVTGEVRAIVPVSTQRSLREVLLTAGGLPATASHTVKIVRPGVAEPIVVDLGPDLAASAAANVPVHPHDIIQITRASVVYVLGAFSHQGAVPLDQASPLTLLQLAALSGGINFEGKYNDLRLIRTVGSERKVVQVDIKKIRDGKERDPILQANDIVFLPTNQMKAVVKSLGVGGILGLVSLLYTVHSY